MLSILFLITTLVLPFNFAEDLVDPHLKCNIAGQCIGILVGSMIGAENNELTFDPDS